MKVRRLDPLKENPGYCHDCHNRAALEITFKAARPPLRLCRHDARYLVRRVETQLANGNGCKSR